MSVVSVEEGNLEKQFEVLSRADKRQGAGPDIPLVYLGPFFQSSEKK